MSTWAIIGIIVLVLGIIISNIMLVKSTANSKFASKLTEHKTKQNKPEDEDDDW